MFTIMQGDQYNIPFIISANETAITPDDISDVEIVISSLNKKYSESEILYEDDKWLFPLTQEESFTLPAKHLDAQVRIKFTDNAVKGVYIPDIISVKSQSKDVI